MISRMPRLQNAVFVFALLLPQLVASSAHAEPDKRDKSDKAEKADKTEKSEKSDNSEKSVDKARALFREGRELVNAQKYAEACPKFEQSFLIERGIGTMYNLADCWEKLGKTASAHAMFSSTAEAARSMGQPERAQLARERAAALAPKLSRLVILVGTPAKGLTLWRDDKQVDQGSWGMATPIDTGSHEIKAVAPGKQPFVAHVEIPEFSGTVSVTVPPLADAVQAPAAKSAAQRKRVAAAPADRSEKVRQEPTDRPEADSSSGNNRVLALVVGGAGVGAVVAGVVLALDYRSKNDDATSICPSAINCSRAEIERHSQLVDDARSSRNWSYLAFGVGGAAVLGAATIYVTSAPRRESRAARIGVSPLSTASGPIGAALHGTW